MQILAVIKGKIGVVRFLASYGLKYIYLNTQDYDLSCDLCIANVNIFLSKNVTKFIVIKNNEKTSKPFE